MKISMSKKILALTSLVIVLASLVVCLLDAFTEFSFGIHPILTFIFCLFAGLGILCFALGFIRKSSWQFFLSAILLGLSLTYVLALYVSPWWIIPIILFAFFTVVALISYMMGSNKTERALNDAPEYKTYAQRKAEKANETEEKVELPKIKSFKE